MRKHPQELPLEGVFLSFAEKLKKGLKKGYVVLVRYCFVSGSQIILTNSPVPKSSYPPPTARVILTHPSISNASANSFALSIAS
jgi:hypothetical protein